MRKFFHLAVVLLCSPVAMLGYFWQAAVIWFDIGRDQFFAEDRED